MTSLPRIGYVLKRYPRYSETFVVTEILAHEAAGTQIDIFALRPVEETHFQDMLGRVRAPVQRVPDSFRTPHALWSLICQARGTLPGGWAALQGIENAEGRDVAQAIIVALACHQRNIGHLHAHFGTVSTSVARLAARLAGITYSFTAHAKDIYHDYDSPVELDAKLRDAAAAVTVSDYNVTYLCENFGADAGKVVRIYNGLDLDRFTWAEPTAPQDEILAVGRLVEKKGFDVLIDAMGLLRAEGRNTTCRIIGAGEAEAGLRSRIVAAGLEDVIRLDGPRPQNEVIAALRGAAMLACPCVVGKDGNRDGLPTVLLEAMALGAPCVATDVTGIPELVRDGETGLCVAQNDAKALAAALGRLLDDPALGQQMSRAGRALIEAEFDITRNAARLRDVFADAVAPSLIQKGAA
ncbi:glycosyltransferase family 4 protein [Pseudorhodobacter aquimaris]|uniref:glycosyltransferase family 4 protein n=1 Tax=Pseudorhodobacter aquimaris TaxID=687412 RepID=UPI00067DD8BF|nr:glycosyltransferase family 4 protein [Pseudorhodobacter aquimaris]